MNYPATVQYLLALGHEIRAQKFGLEGVTTLLADLGDPQAAFPSVLIAGTNGKGSVAAMLDAILRASGRRVGLYTSPHLVRINERIRLNGQEIPDEAFARVFSRIRERIEALLATGRLATHPTYFECLTAIAFEYFREQRAEIGVLEVGMGGRLDATNVVRPVASVITQIDFDHEAYLGHSIEQIAAEKVGIIKTSGTVVTSAERPEALEVIRARAAELGAKLIEAEQACPLEELREAGGQYQFRVPWADSAPLDVTLGLRGGFQVRNALAAIVAARVLDEAGFSLSASAVARGLESVRWPGRMELVASEPDVFLDGAHNPAGAREVARFWREQLGGRHIWLVYGAMRDKAVGEITETLFPLAYAVLLSEPDQPRATSAEALAEMTRHLCANLEVVPAPAAALARALALAAPEDVVFVTGSLYLVGDIRRALAAGVGQQGRARAVASVSRAASTATDKI